MVCLNEIQYFVEVAEKKSFTAAAKQLGIQKSTISRGLASLEERLGVRLIQRTTRRVELTEDGALYFQRCQKAVWEAEQAEVELNLRRCDPRGSLRLAATTYVFHTFLGSLLGEFVSRYPDLTLELSIHPGTIPIDPLAAKLDLVIECGPVKDSSLFVKHLGSIPQAFYCSPHYLASQGAPASPRDLPKHAWIAVSAGESIPTWNLRRGQDQEHIVIPSPRVVIDAEDPTVRLQLAQAGIGITALPCCLASPLEQQQRLVRILPDWAPDAWDLYALYPTPLRQSSKLRVFFQWLQPYLAERVSERPAQFPNFEGLLPPPGPRDVPRIHALT